MRTIKEKITYQCEKCGRVYVDKQNALDCEAIPVFDPARYPTGLMRIYHSDHGNYVGVYAIPYPPEKVEGRHYYHTHYWACRVESSDSLDDRICVGEAVGGDYENNDRLRFKMLKKDLERKEVKRMIEYLQSKKIVPHYYNSKGELIPMI